MSYQLAAIETAYKELCRDTPLWLTDFHHHDDGSVTGNMWTGGGILIDWDPTTLNQLTTPEAITEWATTEFTTHLTSLRTLLQHTITDINTILDTHPNT